MWEKKTSAVVYESQGFWIAENYHQKRARFTAGKLDKYSSEYFESDGFL